MSNRVLDENLLEMLKNLNLRVKNLEAQRDSVRRNDIRLGRMVVATEPDKKLITLTDLNDRSVEYLGMPEPAIFSWSGALSVSGGAQDYAQPHVVPKECSATEIILALRVAATTDTTVDVWFNNGTHMQSITLPANETVNIIGINIPVGRNNTIYPQLTVAGSGATELSVTVRFGYPRNEILSADESP